MLVFLIVSCLMFSLICWLWKARMLRTVSLLAVGVSIFVVADVQAGVQLVQEDGAVRLFELTAFGVRTARPETYVLIDDVAVAAYVGIDDPGLVCAFLEQPPSLERIQELEAKGERQVIKLLQTPHDPTRSFEAFMDLVREINTKAPDRYLPWTLHTNTELMELGARQIAKTIWETERLRSTTYDFWIGASQYTWSGTCRKEDCLAFQEVFDELFHRLEFVNE